MSKTPNNAVNRDAQTAGFAACLAARYLKRWPSLLEPLL